MGSCISRCIPKRTSLKATKDDPMSEDSVHDKNVIISQATSVTSSVSLSNFKNFPCSGSDSHLESASSVSSTSLTNSSCSSRSTASSHMPTLKDRSFSNEFLWNCAKENPHLILSSPIKASSSPIEPIDCTVQIQSLNLQPAEPKPSTITALPPRSKQHFQIQQRVSTPQKSRHYMQVGSPHFPTQTSFRTEPDARPDFKYILPNRSSMRSPSPSRRFSNGYLGYGSGKCSMETTPSRSFLGSRMNLLSQTAVLKENIRPAFPTNILKDNGAAGLRRSPQQFQFLAGSKKDEIAVAEVASRYSILDSLAIEDIDNPHVSLDCFIFI